MSSSALRCFPLWACKHFISTAAWLACIMWRSWLTSTFLFLSSANVIISVWLTFDSTPSWWARTDSWMGIALVSTSREAPRTVLSWWTTGSREPSCRGVVSVLWRSLQCSDFRYTPGTGEALENTSATRAQFWPNSWTMAQRSWSSCAVHSIMSPAIMTFFPRCAAMAWPVSLPGSGPPGVFAVFDFFEGLPFPVASKLELVRFIGLAPSTSMASPKTPKPSGPVSDPLRRFLSDLRLPKSAEPSCVSPPSSFTPNPCCAAPGTPACWGRGGLAPCMRDTDTIGFLFCRSVSSSSSMSVLLVFFLRRLFLRESSSAAICASANRASCAAACRAASSFAT
mmetsp:Transcript_39746/g.112787  ORF Transcript_39746/g.112787 Transcript_39746/m.112787 type:complete len:339 (-) Transcript_39746:1685-2701(-)